MISETCTSNANILLLGHMSLSTVLLGTAYIYIFQPAVDYKRDAGNGLSATPVPPGHCNMVLRYKCLCA